MGSACNHIGALLFKLQACSSNDVNKLAVASKLCAWKRSRSKAEPAPLLCIDFKRPKKNCSVPATVTENQTYDHLKGFCYKASDNDESDNFFKSLKSEVTDACIFKCIDGFINESKDSDSETDTADEDETSSLPEPLTSLFDPSVINKNREQLIDVSKSYYETYKNSIYSYQIVIKFN